MSRTGGYVCKVCLNSVVVSILHARTVDVSTVCVSTVCVSTVCVSAVDVRKVYARSISPRLPIRNLWYCSL